MIFQMYTYCEALLATMAVTATHMDKMTDTYWHSWTNTQAHLWDSGAPVTA